MRRLNPGPRLRQDLVRQRGIVARAGEDDCLYQVCPGSDGGPTPLLRDAAWCRPAKAYDLRPQAFAYRRPHRRVLVAGFRGQPSRRTAIRQAVARGVAA